MTWKSSGIYAGKYLCTVPMISDSRCCVPNRSHCPKSAKVSPDAFVYRCTRNPRTQPHRPPEAALTPALCRVHYPMSQSSYAPYRRPCHPNFHNENYDLFADALKYEDVLSLYFNISGDTNQLVLQDDLTYSIEKVLAFSRLLAAAIFDVGRCFLLHRAIHPFGL